MLSQQTVSEASACFSFGQWWRLLLTALTLSVALASIVNCRSEAAPANDVIVLRADNAVKQWLAPDISAFLGAATTRNSAPSVVDASVIPAQPGWREFHFVALAAGWRKVDLPSDLGTHGVATVLDPPSSGREGLLPTAVSVPIGDWFWVPRGAHRIRFTRADLTSWAPGIATASLIAASGEVARILPSARIFRLGQCAPLTVLAGGTGHASMLKATFTINAGASTVVRSTVAVPASDVPIPVFVPRVCNAAGDISVQLTAASGLPINAKTAGYAVFDTARREPVFTPGPLVFELNPVTHVPDYGSGGVTVVRDGLWRESGDGGVATALNPGAPAPGWFGYRIAGLQPGHAYTLTFAYPNDRPRLFVVALRDSAENGYPPSIAIETGGRWPTDHRMHTASFRFWAASVEARLLVFNMFSGFTGALGDVRIQETMETSVPGRTTRDPRIVAVWSEEGERFRDLVGLGHDHDGQYLVADRYMRLLRASGVNTLVQSMSVYDYQLFPSELVHPANPADASTGAALTLAGERYGIGVVADLHPRADSLLRYSAPSVLNNLLLLSRDGYTNLIDLKGALRAPPYFNLLDPDVHSWYLRLIADALANLAEYPAFRGVQLRLSAWRNPAFNNFVSLDWGYNAPIVRSFFIERGIAAPLGLDLVQDTPAAVKARANVLLGRYRADWIAWRCAKVTALVKDIAARVRTARPDLELWIDVLDQNHPAQHWDPSRNTPDSLRFAGLDLHALASVPGVRIIDSRWQYGPVNAGDARKAYSGFGVDVPLWSVPLLPGRHPSVLWPMHYYEIRSSLWPGTLIGLPDKPISPWISAPAVPPGRYRLARYAQLLAVADPVMIGDGGNGYAATGEGLADFMAAFRSLPMGSYVRVANVPPTVAIRCAGHTCYVVSLSPYEQTVVLNLRGASSLRDAVSAAPIGSVGGTVRLRMAPFALKIVKSDMAIDVKWVNSE